MEKNVKIMLHANVKKWKPDFQLSRHLTELENAMTNVKNFSMLSHPSMASENVAVVAAYLDAPCALHEIGKNFKREVVCGYPDLAGCYNFLKFEIEEA